MLSEKQLDVGAIYEITGYNFKDEQLLRTALTHSSYCYEHNMKYSENNERLEFLGDAIFDAVIGEALYMCQTDCEEGNLSKLRAEVVCEESLLKKADEIGLYKHLYLGKGEIQMGPDSRSKALLADAMEALIGAVYLDGGWENVRTVVIKLFKDVIDDAIQGRLSHDYKSTLQVKLQADGKNHHIEYRTDMMEGPPHARRFKVSVLCDGKCAGSGEGSSKKQAEQNAAREALATEGCTDVGGN